MNVRNSLLVRKPKYWHQRYQVIPGRRLRATSVLKFSCCAVTVTVEMVLAIRDECRRVRSVPALRLENPNCRKSGSNWIESLDRGTF